MDARRKWAAAGGLLTFRRLMMEGLRAQLTTPADCLPDMVWTTFSFGVNPGRLEKYFYVQYEPATARLRYAAASELKGTPFWEYLSRALLGRHGSAEPGSPGLRSSRLRGHHRADLQGHRPRDRRDDRARG
jgi:hypothetical protein